jgi:dihydropteroate synthase/2-amino-4-hydroxy-6-hydroxymethyldihydropteridine diphosphokinase
MILIALGANLPSSEGAPRETLRRALALLEERGVRVTRRSRTYLTEPVPRSRQPWYANQVVEVETDRLPEELLGLLHEIEHRFGRERSERNAARTLDLDILAYHDVRLGTADLVLPHPRLHERAFVLIPLADVAPDWRHPVSGETLQAMTARVDTANVRALRETPQIMGVVNVTPDSFSDGGRFEATETAIAHAVRLMEDGADILDIGGESTRPGAEPVPPAVEQQRVLPVIRAVADEARKRGRLVSVDTRNAETMILSIAAGATLVNDVTALADPKARRVVAESGMPVVLMHMKGEPRTMQRDPRYDDVVAEVAAALAEARDRAVADGVRPDLIWLDPGLGFGKTMEHNLALLDATPTLKALGHRVLIGASRKSFVARIDRDTPAGERLGGSLAAALAAAARGADALRVHDVAETRQALAIWSALEGEAATEAGRR